MNFPASTTVLSILSVLADAAPLAAQVPVPALQAALPDLTAVAFDARDGALWAAGRTYKMSFAGATATYVPFFGSAAPRNFPLRLRVSEARVGGEPLALLDGEPALAGARVSVDRGAFIELFDLAPEQVEHSFRFDALPRRGELLLTLTIDSELAMTAHGDGVAFAGELGRVDYAHALVVDAAGARLPLAIEAEAVGAPQRATSLRLRVPAQFLATAKLPLLVDPVLTTVSVNTSTYSEHSADLAYLAGNTDYGVVFQREFSATDQDVWLQRMDHTGTKVGSPIAIDFTTERWSRPRIASQRVGAKFLVVAEVQAASGTGATWIAGRICNNGSGTVAPVLAIDKEGVAGHHSGNKRAPDVGGGLSDPQPQDFAVVWTRETAPGNRDVHCKRVYSDGTLGAATATVLAAGSEDEFAATISSSNGNLAAVYQRWAVVYTRAQSGHDDVWAAILGLDVQPQLVNGAATFPLALSASDDEAPVVSSPTDTLAGAHHFLCAFSRRFANDNRILGVVFDNNGVVRTTADLSLLDGSPAGFRHRPCSTDTDGVRFVVASSDGAAPGATKTAASLFAWDAAANVLMVHEARASLTAAGTARDLPQVFAMRNGAASARSPSSRAGRMCQTHSSCSAPVYSPRNARRGKWSGGGIARLSRVRYLQPMFRPMHRHFLALATLALPIPLLAQSSIRLTNGVNGGAEIPYAPQMVPQSGITVEAWITYNDATIIAGWSHPTIVRQNINGGQESFFLRVQAENTRRTRLSFAIRTSTSGLTWVNWDFSPGQLLPWTHVAATYDGAMQRLFVNGAEVGSAPGNGQPLLDQGSLLHIGKGDPGSTFSAYEVWNGDIDELRLWPFARTAAEIQSTMNLELSSVPGLVSTWNLNASTGFQDSSSTLHGSAIGAVAFTNTAPALQSIPFPGASTAGASSAGCLGAIEATIGSLPQRGNANFAFVAHRVPANALAAIVFGTQNLSVPFRILGVDLWVDPASPGFSVFPATLGPLGSARFSLPIPGAGRPGFAFAGQFVFVDPCGPQGITASTGLACATIL